MLPFCLTYVQQAISSGATSAAMQLPMYYIQSAPLVGFLLLALRVAQAWVREWKASWHGMKESLKEEILRELHAEAEGKEGGNQ
jgi:TRAP-type C4-dicarboxylate transport system permease small subunit